MKNQIPVYKISEIENPTFRVPVLPSPTLRWFSRLPEGPFDGWWPVFHDGEWHWLSGPPLLCFPTDETN